MYLPVEILKEVGQYLELSEKAKCIRVCYDWYHIFLNLIYTQVQVTSRHQFRQFFNTIKQSSAIQDSLGSQVKELYIVAPITRDELELFPTYFTKLTILTFDPRHWKYMRGGKSHWQSLLGQWKDIVQFPPLTRSCVLSPLIDHFGHQLKSLSLWGEPLIYILNNNLDTSIWNKMPRLDKLSLQGIAFTNINIKMFMAIGAHLPLLSKLTLSCVTLSLDENYLASTTTLPLFGSTTTLVLDDVHVQNWRMVTVMTLAFYHVQTLDFDVTFDWLLEEVSSKTYEKSMDAWMGFSQLCFSLKKVIFRRIESSGYPFPYEAFFHELADIASRGVQVEMYERAWGRTVDPPSTFKFGTARTGLLSNVVMLWSWTGKKTDISLFKSLRACPFLKEVTLSCDVTLRNGFRLDLLLDSCPQVEVVRIANTLMTTSRPIECAADIKYGLRSLSMKNAIIGDHFMDYVAKCCPRLKELSIDSSAQQKPRQSVFVIIRMPDHEFDLIQLDSLHLNPGSESNICRTEAAILSFYESKRYHSQDERRKARQKQYPDQKIPAAEMWRFYHVYKPDDQPAKKDCQPRRLQRLSTTEAARVANFEMTPKKWNSIRHTPARKSFEQKQAWEKDIPFGTVLLLCKSVDRLMFNEIRV